MTVALVDDDRFEVSCTCGWEGYGFPTNVIEEYVNHRIEARRA